jgi:hypothetical protein
MPLRKFVALCSPEHVINMYIWRYAPLCHFLELIKQAPESCKQSR